ncbi:hypothetical protein FA15DRAFT_666633 [Coprinopsis marcescibilis]|uniref:Uncharacterized protein n=1 Tax=Coprinopsis marcescibilis TaxID=230819 RepID=A0A5C3L2A5_COPMA|nr:hypothetical protein FA15DRAFT_666633 [Coprinopsis marcescibilis]
MVSRFAPLAVLAYAAAVFAQSGDITIDTPSGVIVCRPTQFTFSGGEGPWFLTAHPEGQPAAPPTIDFGLVTESPFRWTANITQGTRLFLRLVDQTGDNGESGPFGIGDGPDTSCINPNPAPPTVPGDDETSSSVPPAGSTPSVPSPSAPVAGTSGSPRPNTPSNSAGAVSSGTPRPTATPGSGAFSNKASAGILGLVAVAGAAMLL